MRTAHEAKNRTDPKDHLRRSAPTLAHALVFDANHLPDADEAWPETRNKR